MDAHLEQQSIRAPVFELWHQRLRPHVRTRHHPPRTSKTFRPVAPGWILLISAYGSRFCAASRTHCPSKSFRMNILERCSSLGRRNDPSLAGKSLLQNILRVSPCGSRFCRDPFQSRLTKSFRINILAIVTKKRGVTTSKLSPYSGIF